MKEFNLSKYTMQAENLLAQTKKVFQEMEIPSEGLPQNMQPDEGKIKLVFVGQYSAGKSSIIKMLSGIDTGIGAAITTQQSKEYDWNNLKIVDTPGIHTGLRADHDEITYDEISQAALLVFVITNEGFDNTIGQHFRKLAIEQKRGNNMVLVVNKMDRTMEGNTEEQQAIIRDDLRKVIEPFSPEDVYLSFISTQSYEDYLEETDPEIKADLLAESGHDVFIDNLNAFVAKKQVSSRLQRPLYTLESVLRKTMGKSDDEKGMNGAEEIVKRSLRIVENAKSSAMDDCKNFIIEARDNIRYEGQQCAQYISFGNEVTEAGLNQKLKEASEKISQYSEECVQKINDRYVAMMQEISNNQEKELSSPFAKDVLAYLNNIEELNSNDISNGGDGINALNVAKGVKSGVETVLKAGVQNSKLAEGVTGINLSSGMNLFNANLAALSGSYIHTGIKTIGSFAGIKFAPWEALKWARGLSSALATIGFIGALVQLYEVFTAEDKRRKAEAKVLEAQQKIRSEFDRRANELYDELNKALENQITTDVEPQIENLKNQIQSFADRRQMMKVREEKLSDIFDQEQALMKEINAENK